MSEQLVALTRQDRRLSAIVSRAVVQDEQPPEYRLAQVAVEAVKAVDVCERSGLEAWRRLAEVRLDEPWSVAAATSVLLATVPMGEPASGASPSDGRAWLCQPQAWAALRKALQARPIRTVRLLRESGFRAAVDRILDARDPYAAYHHGAVDAPALLALPPRFRAFVLPLLRGRPWSVVRRGLSLFWALGLERDDARLAVAVQLLSRSPVHGLSWLAFVTREDPTRRDAVAALVLHSGALGCDPLRLEPRALAALAVSSDDAYADRLAQLLRSLAEGLPEADSVDEILFASEFAPDVRFDQQAGWPGFRCAPPRRHPRLPAAHDQDLRRVLRHVQEGRLGESQTFAVLLRRWSVVSPARAAVLARPSLLAWPATVTQDVLWHVMHAPTAWSEAERCAAFERQLPGVPASHVSRAVEELGDVLDLGRMDAPSLAEAQALIARLARPPFRTDWAWPLTTTLLVRLSGGKAGRLSQIPERSLRRLDLAAADDAGPLQDGLHVLGARAAHLLFEALATHPEPLLSVARCVGILSAPRRHAVLKRFRAHPVAQRRFAKRPLDAICAAIEGLVRRGLPSPIPRKLREHREGRTVLSSGSLERHRQAIVRRLLPFRLALLRLLALEEMRRGVPASLSCERERHALQMLSSSASNRRLLRRVLRVPPELRARFIEDHPANRAWLARHPSVARGRWQSGLDEEACVDGRRLRLAFETDPLEVLRMGTLVGSCLSVGGLNGGSAIAVMADVNKRVVFARDAAGTFVARQLVAITESESLACSAVYPSNTPAAIADLFLGYDRRLAAALGLPLKTTWTADDDIARVVARSFYDDGLWDRLASDEATVSAPSSPARPVPSRRSS